ncbi:MAG: SurA N-terminal domain-containing protein [Nitrospirota bacterium]
MLKFLRNKKTAKKVWIGLAIIIIPAFALWGFGGSSRSKEETASVGKIFGHSISITEFKESLSAVKTFALMRFGDKLPEIEKYLNLEAQAWERLVLLHEAMTRKINVSDKEVITTIQSTPYFQDKNGFSNKTYNETLRYTFRVQPRIFEEQTRQNLILTKLYEQITKNVKLNDEQIRQEYLKTNQELNIDYIAGLFSDFAAKIKPSDKESADFFEKNKALFKEPPTKDKPTRTPELAEIKDKVKTYLIQEESKKMAENKIKECLEKIKTLGFSQAAKTNGLKTGQTVFFKSNGKIENLGNAEMFWKAAKELKTNAPSNMLSDENGYYIIKLGSIKPIDEAKFAKEKQEFGQKLLAENKSKTFADFADSSMKKAQ